jgi:hypothetical protein
MRFKPQEELKMAITFTQAQVDAAVNYLMTGGPGGAELTREQFEQMIGLTGPDGIQTPFGLQLQLAINQGHSGIANAKRLGRDQWGTIVDVWDGQSFAGYYRGPGNPNGSYINVVSGWYRSRVANLNVSISG